MLLRGNPTSAKHWRFAIANEGRPAMHARTTTVNIEPTKIAEATHIYEDNIIPAIRGLKGFHAAYLMVDHATGQGVSLTIWASEDDAKAYESSGSYKEQVAKLAALFTSAPTLADYTVTAHT
ncbi:MAG TPA: hypothetical protein VMV29_21690 [Ktedonobacterales bacterium]|nr:hypothetical protein [Ktedonobacterales bacterium]